MIVKVVPNPLPPFIPPLIYVSYHMTGESAITWAQISEKQDKALEGNWTWGRTRTFYYNALTSKTDAERRAEFAQTFKGLGHQMHLIQDMAVPAHVRNDAHPEMLFWAATIDRADSENSFDELKNQWGWGGFTTQDLKRCRLTAMAVALVYNWWSLFVRLANPKARLGAITSRPFLLSGVARRTTHSGQQHLSITTLHGNAQEAQGMLSRVSSMLNRM